MGKKKTKMPKNETENICQYALTTHKKLVLFEKKPSRLNKLLTDIFWFFKL